MNTLAALAIAGAAGVALFLVERKAGVSPAAPTVQQSVPTGGSSNVSGFVNKVATTVGTGVGAAVGAGAAAPIVGKAAGGFVSAEVKGFQQAGTGVGQIAQGNVISGAKNFAVGAARTAAAPITSTYDTVKSWF